MQVGIIGTGNVGRGLATALVGAGHDVLLGSRDPASARIQGIDVVSQADAADHGSVVVIALPAEPAVSVAGTIADSLAGKPVLDTANEYPTPSSGGTLVARIAAAAPEAEVVKAFNTIGANLLTDPTIDGHRATMFVAGDDQTAVETACGLAADIGFDPVVAGGLDAAGHLEHLARFLIHLSRDQGRDIAFRLLGAGGAAE